jgi:stress-induced-phosphoprotein 1
MANVQKALDKKAEGNAAFKAKDFDKAIGFYSEAIALNPKEHTFWSNRSAAYAGKMEFEKAAEDAAECCKVKPEFMKGWFRLASAQYELGQYEEASAAILSGSKWDKKGDAFDVLRGDIAFHHFYQKAKKQLKAGQYKAAVQIIKDGQRIDNRNDKLATLLQEAEKGVEAEEKAARKGMKRDELLKSEGNDLFKNANFDGAIGKYTEALAACSDKSSAVAISCYNNRAACYQQQSNFSGVIEDTSAVLEHQPSNTKALLRRGLAFEGMEKFKLALQDMKALLAIDPSMKVANMAQHRIQSALRREAQFN